MQFDKRDIEAVARSRVVRAEGNKQTYWIGGAMIGMLAGVFAAKYSTAIGIGLVIVGFLILLYYWNILSKKQNTAKSKLLKEWQQEQESK